MPYVVDREHEEPEGEDNEHSDACPLKEPCRRVTHGSTL